MTKEGAQEAVNASALIVAGIYLYRRLVESPSAAAPTAQRSPATPQAPLGQRELAAIETAYGPQPHGIAGIPAQVFLGSGPVAPVPRFVVGWGFTYIVLALLAEGQPALGGWLALLIAAGAVLGNGVKVGSDINRQLSAKQHGRGGVSAPAGNAPTVNVSYGGGPAAAVMPAGRHSRRPAIGGTPA